METPMAYDPEDDNGPILHSGPPLCPHPQEYERALPPFCFSRASAPQRVRDPIAPP
jgi:hypothetical protein